MKKYQLLILILAGFTGYPLNAQFHVQSGTSFFMQSGALVTIDGLTLQPSAGHTLSNITITRSGTAIPSPEPGGQSISRVYSFSSAVSFTGTVGILFLEQELNGLTEGTLQIATRSAVNQPFVRATNSTVDQAGNYVRAAYAGTVSLGQVTALAPEGALPVALIHFDATAEGRSATLSWSTAYEKNSSHFEIQHSLDASNWSILEKVQSHRNSALLQRYGFTHANPAIALNYYRLRMVDLDGSAEFSKIKSLRFLQINGTDVFPNPAAGILNIRSENWDQVTGIILYNSLGIATYRSKEKPEQNIDVAHLPSGVYILRVTLSDNSEENHRIVLGQ